MSVSEEQEQSKKRQWLIRLRFILMCKKPSADENMLHRIHIHSEATNSPVMKCKPRHGRCRWVTELIGSHEKLSVVWMNQAKILKRLQSTTQPHPPPEPYQTDSPLGLRKPAEGRAKAHILFAILPSGITWRVPHAQRPKSWSLIYDWLFLFFYTKTMHVYHTKEQRIVILNLRCSMLVGHCLKRGKTICVN